MRARESEMWMPHALAPELLQNVPVLVDLHLAFFCFILCAEIMVHAPSLLVLLSYV